MMYRATNDFISRRLAGGTASSLRLPCNPGMNGDPRWWNSYGNIRRRFTLVDVALELARLGLRFGPVLRLHSPFPRLERGPAARALGWPPPSARRAPAA